LWGESTLQVLLLLLLLLVLLLLLLLILRLIIIYLDLSSLLDAQHTQPSSKLTHSFDIHPITP
jgi:hypothetical protein